MCASSQSIEPYYKEFLRCARCEHDFEYENSSYRPITLPICGQTICGECIRRIPYETKCPQDENSLGINIIRTDELPTNYPLLILLGESSKLPEDNEQRYGQCSSYMKLDVNGKECQSTLSRPVIQKIFSLLNSQCIVREGLLKALEAARSLGQLTCSYFIDFHQNPEQIEQLRDKVRSALRSKVCAFLEPDMQASVLQLILSAYENVQTLDYYRLVLQVGEKVPIQNRDPFESNVLPVVQLLRHAACFQEEKSQHSLSLQLKSEYREYESLRCAHDTKIIQIAMEHGLYMSPERWSSFLYNDIQHASSMESIMVKLLTSISCSQAIKKFDNIIRAAGKKYMNLLSLQDQFEVLFTINVNPVQQQNTMSYFRITILTRLEPIIQTFIQFSKSQMSTLVN